MKRKTDGLARHQIRATECGSILKHVAALAIGRSFDQGCFKSGFHKASYVSVNLLIPRDFRSVSRILCITHLG